MSSDPSQPAATQQVIGAAANDPKAQAAAMEVAGEAAHDPRIQSAAWNAARARAESAVQEGATQARAGFLEVRTYVQESNYGVRAYCFLAAVALFVSSVLGIFNVFNAMFRPFQYLWAVYNAVFAAVIIIIDGKPEWFTRCWDVQAKLYTSANFLATWSGRAMLYFYVGSINLFLLPDTWLWKVVYICIGSVLCSIAGLMMMQSCGCRCCQPPSSRHEGP